MLIVSAWPAHALTLVDWNLNTVNYPGYPNSLSSDTTFNGVASSHATVAGNLSVSGLAKATSNGSLYTGGSALSWSSGNLNTTGGELNLQRWDYPSDTSTTTGANGNGVPNNWLQFTLTATVGTFTLEKIDLSAWRNAAGAPSIWKFQYSTNGGSVWIDFGSAFTESSNADSTFHAATYTGSVTASSLLIRFIAVGDGTSTGGGTGNLHINQIALEGFTTVPEPSTYGLGILGLMAFVVMRRRGKLISTLHADTAA